MIQKASVTDSHEGNYVVFVMRDETPLSLLFFLKWKSKLTQ